MRRTKSEVRMQKAERPGILYFALCTLHFDLAPEVLNG